MKKTSSSGIGASSTRRLEMKARYACSHHCPLCIQLITSCEQYKEVGDEGEVCM